MTLRKNRKPYEKPRISEVKLEVEEAVLQNCKSTTSRTTRGTRRTCRAYSGCRSNRILGS
ncbi:MAG: hypothetical protein FJ139_11590 [Deltaproteobacteria bacterium]|nr:hypothetical protein [Deltaproteobacteria bacterium]